VRGHVSVSSEREKYVKRIRFESGSVFCVEKLVSGFCCWQDWWKTSVAENKMTESPAAGT
jgi:hypothetical protein